MIDPHGHSAAALWRKLEAEGRLREVAREWNDTWFLCEGGHPLHEYWSLRLSPDEWAYLHGEPESGEDAGVAEVSNLEILGDG